MWKRLPHSFCQPGSGYLTPGFVENGRKRLFVGVFSQPEVAVSVFGMFQLPLSFRCFEFLNDLVRDAGPPVDWMVEVRGT